jgi:hypothetical protein
MTTPLLAAADDFRDVDLGDRRRTRRLVAALTGIQAQPAAGFPKVFEDNASLEAFYRLIGNPDVGYDTLQAHHATKAWERARTADGQTGQTLVLYDTTEYVVSGEAHRPGLAQRGQRQMFWGHHAIAVPERGGRVVHGTVGFHPYVQRKKRWYLVHGDDTETVLDVGSDRWIDLFDEVHRNSGDPDVIHVMDREGDSYALLAEMDAQEASFVTRSMHDRLCELDGTPISAIVEGEEVVAVRDVYLSPRNGSKRPPSSRVTHPNRKSRRARLSVRYREVLLRCPDAARVSGPYDLHVTVVDVVEANPPNGETPVHWRLLTNMPVRSEADALRIVDIYRRRWIIEEYFKAIKTGCAFSKRQANTRRSLICTLSLLLPVAVTLVNLRTLAEEDPKAPWATVLNDVQFEVLREAVPKHRLTDQANVKQVMLAVAALGGHLKSNGDPGWWVLGRGLEDLFKREAGWRAALAWFAKENTASTALN